jgi:hypothetical protein
VTSWPRRRASAVTWRPRKTVPPRTSKRIDAQPISCMYSRPRPRRSTLERRCGDVAGPTSSGPTAASRPGWSRRREHAADRAGLRGRDRRSRSAEDRRRLRHRGRDRHRRDHHRAPQPTAGAAGLARAGARAARDRRPPLRPRRRAEARDRRRARGSAQLMARGALAPARPACT